MVETNDGFKISEVDLSLRIGILWGLNNLDIFSLKLEIYQKT